jgi:hypothetical protein
MTSIAPSVASADWELSAPSGPEAATSSGDGVSPAASAAAIGSPPGSTAATARADARRRAGSGSRQRRIARSTAGSSPSTSTRGLAGVDSFCRQCSSSMLEASNARRPVNSSYITRPSA